MKNWLSIAASTILVCLPTMTSAADKHKDDSDKLGMSTLVVPGQKASKITNTQEISTVITPVVRSKPALCDADLETTYYQNDMIAEVSTGVQSDTCPDHQGTYRLRLFYKSERGETQRIERKVQWSSANSKDSITENFTLGDNAELLRVNSSVIKCECIESMAGTRQSEH